MHRVNINTHPALGGFVMHHAHSLKNKVTFKDPAYGLKSIQQAGKVTKLKVRFGVVLTWGHS